MSEKGLPSRYTPNGVVKNYSFTSLLSTIAGDEKYEFAIPTDATLDRCRISIIEWDSYGFTSGPLERLDLRVALHQVRLGGRVAFESDGLHGWSKTLGFQTDNQPMWFAGHSIYLVFGLSHYEYRLVPLSQTVHVSVNLHLAR